jgi:hypothetical protein
MSRATLEKTFVKEKHDPSPPPARCRQVSA